MASMHTTQEWEHHAHFNMSQALHTQKKANRQIDMSQNAHHETVNENLGQYNELHSSLEQKVKTSYRLVEKLQKRADSLENSIHHANQSLAQLDAALRAKDAPLQLCMWRMEQREKRPLREQVRDVVEVALEEEKATLVDTQRRLSDSMRRTRNMIGQLENKLQEVRHDLDQKTQALNVDEMCLRTTHRSWQVVAERSPPARSAGGGGSVRLPSTGKRSSVPQQVAVHESTKNEVNRQQEAGRLNHSAAGREELSKELREDNAHVIARCERAAEEAQARTERALQERVNENQQMRRRLEGEIRETLGRIDHTKQTISETKRQMKDLEEPMELTATCNSWRKQRATREHIMDPVSTKLAEHQNVLLRSFEDLRNHHQSEKTVLQDLTERRERLREDLRDKTSALHIDLNCLTHEAKSMNGRAAKSLSKNKMSKALKVDPTFVPIYGSSSVPVPMTVR